MSTLISSEALEQHIDGMETDVIKDIFSDHPLEDLHELLAYHTERENYNICSAIKACIDNKTQA